MYEVIAQPPHFDMLMNGRVETDHFSRLITLAQRSKSSVCQHASGLNSAYTQRGVKVGTVKYRGISIYSIQHDLDGSANSLQIIKQETQGIYKVVA